MLVLQETVLLVRDVSLADLLVRLYLLRRGSRLLQRLGGLLDLMLGSRLLMLLDMLLLGWRLLRGGLTTLHVFLEVKGGVRLEVVLPLRVKTLEVIRGARDLVPSLQGRCH